MALHRRAARRVKDGMAIRPDTQEKEMGTPRDTEAGTAVDKDPAAEDPAAESAADRFDRAFDRMFPSISMMMNRFLIDHMLRSARMLELDMESLIILGLLSHLNVAPHLPLPHPGAEAHGPAPTVGGLKPMRLRDLEQISRLPRETIRRKLKRLDERGFVSQEADGWILRSEWVDEDMRRFTKVTARQLLTLADEMKALMRA